MLMTSSIGPTLPVDPSMQMIPVKIGGKLTPPIARLAASTSDFLFSRICCNLEEGSFSSLVHCSKKTLHNQVLSIAI
jgi:hypothetical protein